MIHARIKHKSGAEDERTALIFGPLLYLPANTLWQILRSSCFDNESMPQKGGELLHYEFWPNYNKTEHTSNESYVEPDLLLEFEYFNLLVEIKRKDVQSYRQYEGQWKNEIQAFVNGQTHGENKPLLLIALGGNTSPEAFHTPLGRVYKSSWNSLLIQICIRQEQEKPYTPAYRILHDLESAFGLYHEFRIRKWLEQISPYGITNNTSDTIRTIWKR